MSRRGTLRLVLAAAALLWGACAQPAAVVKQQTHALRPGVLTRVAVAPFYPAPGFQRGTPEGESGADAADLVGRFVTEALAARGVAVIPPSDLLTAFEGSGTVLPRQDASAVGALATREFGATAVVLGVVRRYRDRSGEALGSTRPASVQFEITLYHAPGGQRLWTGQFDETQPALTQDPLRVRHYPGRGSRWLSAGELARWGAERVVAELPQELW